MKQIGRYEVVEQIGRGAMGEVYRAILHGVAGFQKLVALKVLHPMRTDDPVLRSDLIKEARIGAILHHPNIVETFELGEVNNCLYISMELVDGMSLRKLISDTGPLPKRTCWELSLQILKGLHYAQQVRFEGEKLLLIHRDIKPSNILLTLDGTPKITDFGLARARGIAEQSNNDVRGTPAYMSPEQIEGLDLNSQSDLFSVGLLMYEMILGKRLFAEFTPVVSMLKLADIESSLNEKDWKVVEAINPEMTPIIRKLLQKDVQKRYTNAQEAIADLRICKNQGGNDAQALIQQILIQERNAELEDDISIRQLFATTNKIIDEDELYFYQSTDSETKEKQERSDSRVHDSDLSDDFSLEDYFEDEECTEIDTVVPKIYQIFGREQTLNSVAAQIEPRKIIWIHGQKGIGKSLFLKEIHSQNVNSQYIDALYLQGRTVSSQTWYEFLHNNLSSTNFQNSRQSSLQDLKNSVQNWCRNSKQFVVVIDSLSVQYYPFVCDICSLSPNITWVVGALSCPSFLPKEVATEVVLLPPLSEETSQQLIVSQLPDEIQEKLRLEENDVNQGEQSQIADLKQKIQICLTESHGIPHLLIQNAKALQDEQEQLQQHINKVREAYFNDIQIRFEQQSPEAQSVFAQASIIESAFDLDTVEAIASLSTMKSNYWLMDALEELLRSSFLSLQEHRFFIPPLLRKFANRFLNVEIHLNAQLYHAQYFSQFAFIPYADKNFNLDAFVEKRDAVEKDIQMAFNNAFANKWNTLSANLGLGLASIWYRRGPLPKGIALLEQVLSLTLSNREKANVLALLGNYCRHFGQYAFSLSQLREALEIFEQLDDKIGIMESTRNLALSYADNGNFQICKAMLSRSYNLVQELNIPYQRILFFKEKGWILSQMGQPDEALVVLHQALQLFPLDHHFMSRCQIHSNIGLIYFRKNNLEKANQHYNKALIYAKHAHVTDRMGLVSLNIALCSILSGENHVAEQAFQEGTKQLKRIKNYRGLATLQANLALFRLTNGKLDAAREYAKRSRMLCKRFPHPVTEYLLAYIHTFLHIKKMDYQKAYLEISFAKDLINSKQVLYKYTECYAVCVEVLVRMNNMEEAQKHFDALLKKISNREPSHLFLKSYAEYWLLIRKSSKSQCQERISDMFAFVKKHLPNRPDISFLVESAQKESSDLSI